ncbi:MAG TPA: protein translocase subunit SecD [Waddliaceae bacterium]
MEKQKRWQFYLIIAVTALTLFNILPTIFYYTKPLKNPITEAKAQKVAVGIIDRVNQLEGDSQQWLTSFSKLLGIKPISIKLKEDDPGLYVVTFKNPEEAKLFKRFLPQAGALIPFIPAQLELYPSSGEIDQSIVIVARQISLHLNPNEAVQTFHYFPKREGKAISNEYKAYVDDRAAQLAVGFGGTSNTALRLAAIAKSSSDALYNDATVALAKEIADIGENFGESNSISQRYFASFTQSEAKDRDPLLQKFLARVDSIKSDLEKQRQPLLEEQKKLQKEGKFLDRDEEQRLSFINNQYRSLEAAGKIIRKNLTTFKSGKRPWNTSEVSEMLAKGSIDPLTQLQFLSFEGRDPIIQGLVIDWGNDKIQLQIYDDVQKIRLSEKNTEESSYLKDKINQLLINNIARVSRIAEESIAPSGDEFAISLTNLPNTQSFLSLDLGYVASTYSQQILQQILSSWQPQSEDLKSEVFPVLSYDAFKKLDPRQQKLGLMVYAPAVSKEASPTGFRPTSIYVVAKGLDAIIQKYQEAPNSPDKEALLGDIQHLTSLLQSKGFIVYSGSSLGMDEEFSNDYIFEKDDYYSSLLGATREDFYVKGSKKSAILDFSDIEQRITALNKIEDRIQEDLLKWRDEYYAAQADINTTRHYEVPPPTKNVYWENLKLTLAKYFRGDEQKVLKWGLDLSGGKTVRIGLRDQSNRPVTQQEDLKQAVNELYARINKMGVSERTIRIESNNIILDFPGSQALSATELVKASAMYFHIVNEKFGNLNPMLKDTVNQFLQDVWNEAVVTNRKDVESINEIAWEHLGLETQGQTFQPRTESARILIENGLRLANPKLATRNAAFNDTLSSVALMHGNDFSEWEGQSHPLIFIFHNYALEGASLTNIQVGYDPSEGNLLNFGIKRAYEGSQNKAGGNPRDDFHAWTSQFAEDKIAGTPKEAYSQGRGWRMAVILNDTIITKPHLRAALRDNATISGRFTSREINQLAADLKAGSLSFAPRILSEQNISAELGKGERQKGIVSSLVGLLLVAGLMIGYYRFGGLVATCAVLFNLLIMWGVLQNIGAALTLPGIAGIVLTIGMAVDANVLVFERVREEFKISGRIASAIQAGYKKAFSAIIDSNITTILAALILIQFDSGPIKGFAVTLIIGLLSSMFTALFMTRYFFAGWVQNPKHKSLNMAQFIGQTQIDFLGYSKQAITISIILIVVGGAVFLSQRNTMFGMDFTGGYSLVVEMEEQAGEPSYRHQARETLLSHGAGINDFEVKELSKPNQLRFQFSLSMEEPGHPFYKLPSLINEGVFTFEYEKDPRLVWVVKSLGEGGLKIKSSQLVSLDKNWSMMSGQFSEAMRSNAILALACALLSILIYITLRFEFKFAVAAVVALAHDVIIALGIFAIFHWMGFPAQIDLTVVGAIMTLIGYSLNDTIIVFDRIREDIRIMKKLSFAEIINHAINVTLSRTIMTSSTTLIVLLALVLLGGKTIFGFSLMMTVGVFVGTFSSIFIAGPALLYLHNREEKGIEERMAH